jgi:hypothetical protein
MSEMGRLDEAAPFGHSSTWGFFATLRIKAPPPAVSNSDEGQVME